MQDSPSPATTSEPTAATGPAAAAESPEVQKRRRNAIGIVFLVVFIDLLGFGLVIPLLSVFGETYLEQLFPGDRMQQGLILGLLMASFSAMQFVFAPMWGRISDSVGRRPILLLGLVGSAVFYTLFGYACDLDVSQAALAVTLLFVARTGAGIAGATIATAQAVIADCTPPEKRKIGMAMIGAAFGIGFTFGPLVGFACLTLYPGFLGSLGYVAATLSLTALLLGIVLLPETRRFGTAPPSRRRWFSWHDTRAVLSMPTIGLLVLIFFLSSFGFGAFEPTLALLNEEVLHLPKNRNMLVFAYVGFVLLMTQGVLYRRLAKRFSELTFMTLGVALMGGGLLLLGVFIGLLQLGSDAPSHWNTYFPGVLVSLTLAVVGFAFLTPSIQALISRRSDPERQGEILGVNQSASALARILGPFFGVVLYKIPGTAHMLPYGFGAVVLLAMLTLIPRVRKE